MTTRTRRLAAIGVAGLAALAWLHLLWQTVRPTLALDHWRTPSYWVAPQLALDGRAGILYDDEAFAAASEALGSVPDIYMPNPPVTLLPLLPLAGLDELTARNLVIALGLAAAVATAVLLGRAARLGALGWAVAALGLAVYEPLRHGVVWGQVYTLVLLAITIAALAGGRSGSGPLLGVAAIFKYPFPVAAAGALFVAGRVRAGVVAGLVLAVGVVGSVVAWGLGPWQAWLAALGPWGDRPVHAVTALQMPRGLLTRLFDFHPRFSPTPIVDAPVVGDVLWLALAVAVALGTVAALWRARQSGASLLAVAVALPAALLLSPYVDDYTYVLALLPLVVGAMALGLPGAFAPEDARPPGPSRRCAWAGGWRVAGWVVLGIAAVLLGAAIPFREAEPAGLEALLWYPRVWGTLLLWGLLVALALSGPARALDRRAGGAGARDPEPTDAPGAWQAVGAAPRRT